MGELEILYRALASDNGVEVQVLDQSLEAFLMQLSRARDRANDSHLSVLKFRRSPIDTNMVWITKDAAQTIESV